MSHDPEDWRGEAASVIAISAGREAVTIVKDL
jgi:hypothetical protein